MRRHKENKRRVIKASKALADYDFLKDMDGEDVAVSVVDLLADLRHLCDHYGVDYADADRQAQMHYTAEVTGEEP